MSGYVPEVGHRVRVVLEGEVVCTNRWQGLAVDAGVEDRRYYFDPTHPAVVSVERLPDPEPEYRAGDVVRSRLGGTFFRSVDGWVGMSGTHYGNDAPARPLTLLVRDGKPVK